FAPPGQLEAFAGFVKKMALAACNWKAIVYLTPTQMDEFAARLDTSPTAEVLAGVRELVGIPKADEIYLCRNWQFANRLLIHAYRHAEKLCYGDGIGFYFTEAYFLPTAVDNRQGLRSLVRGKLRGLKTSLKATVMPVTTTPVISSASDSTVLGEIAFDVGYFLLPDILGQKPPMKTRQVSSECTQGIFRKLAAALDTEHLADSFEYISRVPTVVLMTSNFSEAMRMSGEKEIVAYRKFLQQLALPPESTLIIKPHPRDGEEKIRELGRTLRDLFSDVVLLTDPNLFFVPFEIFLMQIFKGEKEKALRDLKIVTFSSACLSLEVLFQLEPIVGFGSELVSKFFYEAYVSGRIRHENDLQLALQKLAPVA
ncbi:MAG TPA: polysialyltransferase family glycosyltransferase, partial [Pyrinomonadaceae bacterium]|nr:polysialyltransferase family glycosyltransferase [Pyrinomonadaceae bacterium]